MCEKYILYSNLCSNFGFVPRFDTDTYLDTIGQFVSGYVSRFIFPGATTLKMECRRSGVGIPAPFPIPSSVLRASPTRTHIMASELSAQRAELDLNCLVHGNDSSRVFTISIAESKNVSALQQAIMEANKNTFADVDAHALEIYKVSLPDDYDLHAKLLHFRPRHDPDNSVHHLNSPMKPLKAVFEHLVKENIHLIVLPPFIGIGEC
jgi:hypothetical protein